MNTEEALKLFESLRVYKKGDTYAVAKPALLLVALSRCFHGKERLASINAYVEENLRISFSDEQFSFIYPFGRLSSDGLWEIKSPDKLTRTSSGDLLIGEMNEYILGGFESKLFDCLSQNKNLIKTISARLIKKYFPDKKQEAIHNVFFENLNDKMKISYKNIEEENQFKGCFKVEEEKQEKESEEKFVAYLNSLHNIKADGANALAESQAMSRYFGELYEPLPLAETIFEILGEDRQRIVILTGHAGDGKSTVALDVLKRLHGLPLSEPLTQPLKDLEKAEHPHQAGRRVSIVKDMSELSGEQRLRWLSEAFDESSSWLIVSNTGPLLNTLRDYTQTAPGDFESRILAKLNVPYTAGDLETHTLTEFAKDLVILNMTRLDNIEIGASLLLRMLEHSGWDECAGCSIEEACPLLFNRCALRDSGTQAVERVRWIYQRLTAYEQRLTLRQMVAHLAFSLTGGMSCEEAKTSVGASTTQGPDRATNGLEEILFSECFFGYQHGKLLPATNRLKAVELTRRQFFGAPIAVDFDRQLLSATGWEWADLPDSLVHLEKRWRILASEATGGRWRFALRRLLYFFGKPKSDYDRQAATYFDTFLQSPRLRDFDRWRASGKLDLSSLDQDDFCRICLRVLLEIYSGFSSGQFSSDSDEYLYLTLRRPDRAVVQPTQLVVAKISFDDFDFGYDSLKRLLLLRYKQGKPSLPLTLPLLDFIQRHHEGQLGTEISQIHLSQIEWFRSELLKRVSVNRNPNDIIMLRARINGETCQHRYFLDLESKELGFKK